MCPLACPVYAVLGDGAQGFIHARQMVYQPSDISGPWDLYIKMMCWALDAHLSLKKQLPERQIPKSVVTEPEARCIYNFDRCRQIDSRACESVHTPISF